MPDVLALTRNTYDLLADPGGPRFVRHEGGTSSGKTRGIAHAWVRLLTEQPGKLSVVRESGPVMRRSVQEDVEIALRESGLPFSHSSSENVYTLSSGGRIEMLSLDGAAGPMKAHGPRRDHLWLNEANETSLRTFDQLELRTRGRVVLDYNPAMEDDHWVFTRFDELPLSECVTFRSTFRDNPFLEQRIVRKILSLKTADPYGFTVYGEGKRGVPAYAVLPHVAALPEWPVDAHGAPLAGALGLDFGFHDPMTLVRVARRDVLPTLDDPEPRAILYVWVLVHEPLLTTGGLVKRLPDVGVERGERVRCDSAEPDRIKEIQDAGYRATAAHKGAGSVKSGVDWLKRHTILVGGPAGETGRSELKRYRNKETNGKLVDVPLDADNHVADAVRYAVEDLRTPPAPAMGGLTSFR